MLDPPADKPGQPHACHLLRRLTSCRIPPGQHDPRDDSTLVSSPPATSHTVSGQAIPGLDVRHAASSHTRPYRCNPHDNPCPDRPPRTPRQASTAQYRSCRPTCHPQTGPSGAHDKPSLSQSPHVSRLRNSAPVESGHATCRAYAALRLSRPVGPGPTARQEESSQDNAALHEPRLTTRQHRTSLVRSADMPTQDVSARTLASQHEPRDLPSYIAASHRSSGQTTSLDNPHLRGALPGRSGLSTCLTCNCAHPTTSQASPELETPGRRLRRCSSPPRSPCDVPQQDGPRLHRAHQPRPRDHPCHVYP